MNKLNARLWYIKNRKKHIEKVKARLKETNYATEKTPKQRKIRSLKRRTRELYPLKNQVCAFCGLKAEEHHHYTNPIEIHKFLFVCHECHMACEREGWLHKKWENKMAEEEKTEETETEQKEEEEKKE